MNLQKKIYFIFLFFIASSVNLDWGFCIENNIEWIKFVGSGHEYIYSILQTSDKGYILAGCTCVPKYEAAFLRKIDHNGEEIWNKTFNGLGVASFNHVIQTYDNCYIMTGNSYVLYESENNIYIVKTSSIGNIVWSKTYSINGYGRSIIETKDHNYLILGYNTLIEIDLNGNVLWSKKIYNKNQLCIQKTSDECYVIVSTTPILQNKSHDIELRKIDNKGNDIWIKNYGGYSIEEPYHLEKTQDNGFIIIGMTRSYGLGYYDIYLIKTNSEGNMEWNKTYGGIDYDIGYYVKQTDDGGYFLTCERDLGGIPYIYAIKTDDTGKELWYNSFGPWVHRALGIPTLDGGYFICTKGVNGTSIIKLDGSPGESPIEQEPNKEVQTKLEEKPDFESEPESEQEKKPEPEQMPEPESEPNTEQKLQPKTFLRIEERKLGLHLFILIVGFFLGVVTLCFLLKRR